MTDPPILQAYKLDGRLLWTINLGKNIREGAPKSPAKPPTALWTAKAMSSAMQTPIGAAPKVHGGGGVSRRQTDQLGDVPGSTIAIA
jgi:hypothetical protein